MVHHHPLGWGIALPIAWEEVRDGIDTPALGETNLSDATALSHCCFLAKVYTTSEPYSKKPLQPLFIGRFVLPKFV